MALGSLLVLAAVVSSIVVAMLIICSCLLNYRRRRDEDTIPILEEGSSLTERLHEIHETRRRARRAREPPPTFEDALVNSRPVSYINIDEPPPPTYDEFLNATPNKDYLEYMPSVNPSDIIIPLDISNGSARAEQNESTA